MLKKSILYRILAILLIMFGFEWLDILQPIIQRFFGTLSIFTMSLYSLPVTIILIVAGLKLFDSTFALSLTRPLGAYVIGAILIRSSTIIFDIFKPWHWAESLFIWELKFEGLTALLIICGIFILNLTVGIGFLRLKFWAWWFCLGFVVFSMFESLIGQYDFIKSGAINAVYEAANSATIPKDVILNTHIQTIIFTAVFFGVLTLYLLVIKGSFNRKD